MEVIKSDSLCKKLNMQDAVTTRIITKLEEIEEIYYIGAEASSVSAEFSEGAAMVSGKLNFKLLVKDKTEGVVSLNYNADFSEKMESEVFSPDSVVCTEVTVTEATGEIMSGNEIEVTAEIDIVFTVKCVTETETSSLPEGVTVKSKKIRIVQIDCCREENFAVTHEMTMPAGAVKVLQAESCAYLERIESGESIRLEGRVQLTIVYLNSENLPATLLVPVNFEQETDAGNVAPEDKICGYVKCVGTKVHLDMDESEALNLTADINLKAILNIFRETEKNVIEDAYSVTHDIETKTGEISSTFFRGMQTVKVGFKGEAACTNSVSRTLGIAGAKCVIVGSKGGEGNVRADVAVKGRILYLNGDDMLDSAPFEIPVSALCALPFAGKDGEMDCSACVTDIAVRRSGGSADITGSIAVSICMTERETVKFLSEIIQGEAKGISECAIEAVLAEPGDTLWNIGKTLGMTVEELLALNPELSEPITKPERIVIYRQL